MFKVLSKTQWFGNGRAPKFKKSLRKVTLIDPNSWNLNTSQNFVKSKVVERTLVYIFLERSLGWNSIYFEFQSSKVGTSSLFFRGKTEFGIVSDWLSLGSISNSYV